MNELKEITDRLNGHSDISFIITKADYDTETREWNLTVHKVENTKKEETK